MLLSTLIICRFLFEKKNLIIVDCFMLYKYKISTHLNHRWINIVFDDGLSLNVSKIENLCIRMNLYGCNRDICYHTSLYTNNIPIYLKHVWKVLFWFIINILDMKIRQVITYYYWKGQQGSTELSLCPPQWWSKYSWILDGRGWGTPGTGWFPLTPGEIPAHSPLWMVQSNASLR